MKQRLIQAVFYRWSLLSSATVRRSLGKKVLQLDQLGFALLSNNCIAGQLYEMANLVKRTPTAGLFFRNRAFARFLTELHEKRHEDWSRVEASSLGRDAVLGCPVWDHGSGDDVVFLHYASPEVAAAKWNARFSRLKERTPVVIATLRDGIQQEDMEHLRRLNPAMTILQPNPGVIDNDGLNRRSLKEVDGFLEQVLASADGGRRYKA